MENDAIGAGGGEPQASLASPPDESFDGGGNTVSAEPEVEHQNNLCDDEEDVCRICRLPGDGESPLYYPCACSGSMKYIHEHCLLQWLDHKNQQHRNARQCEICNRVFAYSPVYALNTPSRLPVKELLREIVSKAASWMPFLMRLLLLLSVWVLVVPFTTTWMCRLAFVRSLSEALELVTSCCTPFRLYLECAFGFSLSAVISFMKVFWHLWRRRRRRQAREQAQEGVARRYAIHIIQVVRGAVVWVPPAAWQALVAHLQERERAQEGLAGRLAGILVFQGVLGAIVWIPAAVLQAPLVQPVGMNGNLIPRLAAAPHQANRRNAADDDAPLEPRIAQLLGHQWEMNIPFFGLIKSAITILTSNAIAVALAVFIPFTLGRLALYLNSRRVFFTRVVTIVATSILRWKATSSSIMDTLVGHSSASLRGGHVLVKESGNTPTRDSGLDGVLSSNNDSVGQNVVIGEMAPALRHSDTATVAVGYGAILLTLSLYLGLILLIRRYRRREPLPVMTGVKYLATAVKVALVLLFKLGIVFLVCGWWLDISTLGMRDVSIAQQLDLFWSSPLTSSLLHWILGIIYKLHISIFLGLLRKVLRPGELSFFRDSADPHSNVFHNLIHGPIHEHAWRVLFSIVAHGSLIVMVVFLPVRLAILIAPSLFPLDIRLSGPLNEFLKDTILYLSYGVVIFIDFGAMIKAGLYHWFSVFGWALGLGQFLRPGPEDKHVTNEQERGPRIHQRQDDYGPDRNSGQAAADEQREGEEQVTTTSGQESADNDVDGGETAKELKLFLRISMLLIAAWVTVLGLDLAAVLVPAKIGHWISSLLHMAQGGNTSDRYAKGMDRSLLWNIIIGYTVLRPATATVRYVMDYLRTHGAHVVCMQVLKWSAIVANSALMLALWLGVLPFVGGILFKLMVVTPFEVPVDENPVSIIYLKWNSHWVVGHVFVSLIWVGHWNLYAAPELVENLRIWIARALADGFANLPVFVLKEILVPMLLRLLTALCVPYAFARWIFPSLGCSLVVNSAVHRFAWLGGLAMAFLCYGGKRMWQWFSHFHNSIRDNRYLVGRRITNFGGEPKDKKSD